MMDVSKIERCIKRRLSDAEREAINRVVPILPFHRRKAKRVLRQARTKARKAELAAMRRVGRMSEPSPDDIRRANEIFSTWQAPAHFAAEVGKLNVRVPSEKLWGNPYKRLREAITLATFCEHNKPLSVRLGEDPPDGWVRFKPDEDEAVEITEVLEPDRRRGDEYKKFGFGFATFVPEDQVAARDTAILAALTERIEAKAGAEYDCTPRLLVYLNFPHRESTEAKIKETVAELKTRFSNQLRDIHVVTDRKVLA